MFDTPGENRKYYPPFVGGYLIVEEKSRGYGHAPGIRRRDILYTDEKHIYKGSRDYWFVNWSPIVVTNGSLGAYYGVDSYTYPGITSKYLDTYSSTTGTLITTGSRFNSQIEHLSVTIYNNLRGIA